MMTKRTVWTVVCCLMLLLGSWGLATAGTLRQKYEKALQKAALPFGALAATGKFKGLCVCDSSHLTGVMETYDPGDGTISIVCAVPTFNSDGSLGTETSCGDWTPLNK